MTKKKYEMPVNLNDIIVNRMKEKYISNTELARLLQMHHSSVLFMLKNPGMQIRRLWTICEAVDLNVFRYLANEIGINDPEDSTVIERDIEIQKLKKEIEDLKKERDLLKEVIGLRGR
ncbi:helix-turn-helix domain-containing protein [Labilibaculum sp.]|uniref:helix-turn-helix domain-containing protein n=1 Tax=Labilibaculum sp. TaxID=2060723 RepID=UPI002AA775D6|nr:helix-turn-helix domain-containing protein [Labilibaculum sp.]